MKLGVRTIIAAVLTIAIMIVFVARLMNIQIVNVDEYRALIGENSLSKQVIKATRGEIVDRSGEPLAANRTGYDVIIDKATLDLKRDNEIILSLIALFEKMGESYTDNLPITKTAPYQFLPDQETDVARVKKLLNLAEQSTAEDAMYWLDLRYGTGRKDRGTGEIVSLFAPNDARKIIGVQYEMEQRGFSYSLPYTFATDVAISSVVQIKERSYYLKGVDVIESTVRVNPNGTVAPHLIGQIGPIYAEEWDEYKKKGYALNDYVGKSGAEIAFEQYLHGTDGERQIFFDSNFNVTGAQETQAPVPGKTIRLTIDKDFQQVAEEALAAQIKWLNENALPGEGREADNGAVVVVEVKTGRVLACVTWPSYDLNRYREDYTLLLKDENKPLYNRALQGIYAPGSCFKPCTSTAGLGSGTITEGSTYVCGRVFMLPGSSQRFTCLGSHGPINVLGALRVSCNIFFYNTGLYTGIETVDKVAQLYGLGEYTGVELYEEKGYRSNPETKLAFEGNEWYPGDTLQSSIGQLYAGFTPIQLANYAATIGNRGTRMKLTLVDEIRDYSQQNIVQPFKPVVAATIDYPRDVFETVIQGMVAASRPGGTAAQYFGNYPITVASKTGTPETLELPNSTFICFAPAEDPEIAIAVAIEKGWHGYTGAPVAKAIFDEYFGYNKPQE